MQTIPYPVYYVLVVNDGEILAGHYCKGIFSRNSTKLPRGRNRCPRDVKRGSKQPCSSLKNKAYFSLLNCTANTHFRQAKLLISLKRH